MVEMMYACQHHMACGNIERFEQVDRDGNYSGLEFHLSIANTQKLDNILYKLRQLPEVLKASRKEFK